MSDTPNRRFVTVVYEIIDDAAWRGGGNPLSYEHHGLRPMCVSAGDLATFIEEIEGFLNNGGELTDTVFNEMYSAHVRKSLPSGVAAT